MTEDPYVSQVREWRRQVAQDLEGKSWAEIAEILEKTREQRERDLKKARPESSDPAA